jgi:K+-sensing histidine kinase KdpD
MNGKYDPVGQVIRVNVADNGPGIPPEHLDKILNHSSPPRIAALDSEYPCATTT